MNMDAVERVKQQWLFAADAMPQLICLIDDAGRVLRANLTLERWNLGSVATISGTPLHDMLHRECSDPACAIRMFWDCSVSTLASEQRSVCEMWDETLRRHLRICIQLPVQDATRRTAHKDFFAVASIEDVSAARASEDESRRAAKALSERVEREARKRAEAEGVRSRLMAMIDRIPSLVASADRTGVLSYLNPSGRALMGMSPEASASGLTLLSCQACSERARIAEQALPAARRDGVWSGDSVLAACDGSEFRSTLTIIAHRDQNGELQGYSMLARDMSAWVRTEEALKITQSQVWRLSAQHLTIQESERRRIAADLHDGLGQALSLVKLSIEEAARSVRNGSQAMVA
ncbi:MAG: PAS domain-containing protein, partial [Gammaproteobacteria bacterium]|nr:PAS domain-containing protein [Gammaproteobacteria bacterium]